MNQKYKLALVTGASSGIGKSFAIKFASLGMDLILVARSKDKLNSLAKELTHDYNVKAKVIVADLSDENEVMKLYEKTKNENIDILVNNAGFGEWKAFEQSDIENNVNMINLNIKAVYLLTRVFMPSMMKQHSGIINVASIAGILPAPLYATYGATKSFVIQMDEAINFELKNNKKHKLRLMTLCPGAVKTNFANVATNNSTKQFEEGMNSEELVEIAWNDFLKGKTKSIPGKQNKFFVFVNKLSRNLVGNTIYKIFKKMVK